MDQLYAIMRQLVNEVPDRFHRYLYGQINWDNRMLGIVGPRGTGKTTMFLQHIKAERSFEDALFVSADAMYFAGHTLFDMADSFVKNGGMYLYIDEVHKYDGWSRELKSIYDAFPQLHVYFTGSSILDIEKGDADLSRRAPKYELQGLSFREFLGMCEGIDVPVHSLDDILEHKVELLQVKHPLPLFRKYLERGYYPFGSDPDFTIELGQVVNRTLEVDIPLYANMTVATGRKLRRLMALAATLVPFKPNFTKLASQIGVSRNNVEEYLVYLEKAGMIARLEAAPTGINALGKVEKVYLDNTNLLYNLGNGHEDIGTVRETFFFNQMRVNWDVYAAPSSDFLIDDVTFEVGGKNKGPQQLKGAKKGYVVKDDIEYGHGNVVPLWAFGLTY